MRFLKRFGKLFALTVIVLGVIVGAYLGYLLTTNTYPRPEGDGWVRLRDLPRPRGEAGATTVPPPPPGAPATCPQAPCPILFYVVGGLAGPLGTTVGDVDILDTRSGTWAAGPSLPESRHHPAAAAIEGAVYVSGGAKRATDWTPRSTFWVLRPGSDAWDPLPEMPEGRMGHAMVASDGRLYVIGGRGETSRVLIYDRTTGWSFGAEMPAPRDHLAAVAVEGKIYAIGGRDDRVLARVDVFDVGANSWSPGPDLPRGTSGMAAELLADGRIHVVGGEDPRTLGGEVIDRHFALDPASNTWSTGPKPLLAVHGAAADEVGGTLLVVGGSRREGSFSVLAWTGVTQHFDPAGAPVPSPLPTPSPTTTPTPSPSPSPSPTTTPTPSPSPSPTTTASP